MENLLCYDNNRDKGTEGPLWQLLPSPRAVARRCRQSDGADPSADGWKREDHRAAQKDPPPRTGCRDPPATTLLGKHPLSITTASGRAERLKIISIIF